MGERAKLSQSQAPSGIKVRIEHKRDGRWLVVCDDLMQAWWAADCLPWAAYSALHFAAVMQLEEPELGEGVPKDALQLGKDLELELRVTGGRGLG